jgi:cell division initiation protein
MNLTPMDIRKQRFRKTMRGYDPVEVEAFLDMVAQETEAILRQMNDLREKSLENETQLKDYRQIEKTLQQMLLQAQETTGKTYESARQEATAIIKEAETKAGKMMNDATDHLSRANNELAELAARKARMVARIRALLNAELEVLASLQDGGPAVTGKNAATEEILSSVEDVRPTERH